MSEAKCAVRTRRPVVECARILLENLPQWLDMEIRGNLLSICEWGAAEEPFRAYFPQSRLACIERPEEAGGSFDILALPDGLQFCSSPWAALCRLGSHAARHMVILVPSGAAGQPPEHLSTFDETTIPVHVDPDFELSVCQVVRAKDGMHGQRLLMVYSRPWCFPQSGACLDGLVAKTVPEMPLSALQERQIAGLSERVKQLTRELQEGRRATVPADLWREKSAELEQRFASERRQLEEQISRLRDAEQSYTAENRVLSSRASAVAYEADTLRRLVAELRNSLSWKVTAPLRFVSRPLFRAMAPQPAAPAPPPSTPVIAAAPAAVEAAPPLPERWRAALLERILPELRLAPRVAVIPCGIPFGATLNQRPIACARYLADHGWLVLFVSWQWSPEEPIPNACEEVYPGIYQLPLYTFQENIDRVASASRGLCSYVCTLPSAGLVRAASLLRAAGFHIHYDVMDDWEGFHRGGEAPWFSAAVERELVIVSDSVTTVSDRLAEKFQHLRGDIAVLRNGYAPAAMDCEQFAAARSPLAHPKTIGYFGHFSDAWFDWDTVAYGAGERPEVHFEMIGWGLSDSTRMRLAEYPNIRFVGVVPQKELHNYARKWWGGMIPFAPSELSAAVDPLKIYEYLHLGLPSVVTGISGIAAYPLVHYARNREEFVSAIDSIEGRPGEASLTATARFLEECVWEARLATLNRLMEQPSGLRSLYAR
jgi:glycosyltransferase involved in cell wall biosynthesis